MLNMHFSLVSILFVLLGSTSALAEEYSHVLTAQPALDTDDYEAVITWSNQDVCYLPINEPSSILVTEAEVHIVSPGEDSVLCIDPAPPEVFYQKTASIGKLAPGEYSIYWDQTGPPCQDSCRVHFVSTEASFILS